VGVIMIMPFALGYFLIPTDQPLLKSRSVDWLGSISLGTSLFLLLLTLTLSETSAKGWRTPCTSFDSSGKLTVS
jgi:hypothetical protein